LMRDGRSWTAGPAREPAYPARFQEAEPGTVHTVAGTGSGRSAEPTGREVGKPATEVALRGDARWRRMAVDHDGTLLVADSRSGLFAVTRDGTFDQPFAIDGTAGYWVTRTGLWPAEAVAVGPDGSRFVAANGVVYHLARDKQPVPIAGHGEEHRDRDRIEEGKPATLSQFAGIFDLAVGPNGMLYIVTSRGVYRLNGDGTLSPVFRRAHHTVQAVAVDAEDRVYVAAVDHGSPGSGTTGHLYRVAPGAEPTVIAGNGEESDVDIEEGARASDVALGIPSDVAVDDDGTVYLGTGKGVLRVDTDGTVLTFVNDSNVTSLVLDRHGDLYFADEENRRVKVLVQPGELSGPFPWGTVSWITAGVVVLAAAGWFGLRRRLGGSRQLRGVR
jgi:outer membrane protein assembly factor BamB